MGWPLKDRPDPPIELALNTLCAPEYEERRDRQEPIQIIVDPDGPVVHENVTSVYGVHESHQPTDHEVKYGAGRKQTDQRNGEPE